MDIKIKNLQKNKKRENEKLSTSNSQPKKIFTKNNKDLNSGNNKRKEQITNTQKSKKNASTNQAAINSSKPMIKSKSMTKMKINNIPSTGSSINKTIKQKNLQNQSNKLKSKTKELNFSSMKSKISKESFKNEKNEIFVENESMESMKAELLKLRKQVQELTFDNERLNEELFREKEQNNKIRNFAEEVMKFYNQ